MVRWNESNNTFWLWLGLFPSIPSSFCQCKILASNMFILYIKSIVPYLSTKILMNFYINKHLLVCILRYLVAWAMQPPCKLIEPSLTLELGNLFYLGIIMVKRDTLSMGKIPIIVVSRMESWMRTSLLFNIHNLCQFHHPKNHKIKIMLSLMISFLTLSHAHLALIILLIWIMMSLIYKNLTM